MKKVIYVDFGKGMEHIKSISGKEMILINTGFAYDSQDTTKENLIKKTGGGN